MKGFRHFGAALLFFIVFMVYGNSGRIFAHETGKAYVVLGDSVEFGIGSTVPENAWVTMFHDYLESTFFGSPGITTEADLHNHSVPGATVGEVMRDQLAPAVSDIESHNPVVVSWGGGGNDLLNFINSPQAVTCLTGDTKCIARLNALLNNIEEVLDLTVRRLRAAGPSVPILLRTQYNPLLRDSCGGPTDALAQLASLVLEGSSEVPLLTRGLNDRIRAVAARYNARAIEIFLVFAYNANTLIADDCVHPNDAGHVVIEEAAVTAF